MQHMILSPVHIDCLACKHAKPKLDMGIGIPDICHFFTQAKFLENKIYTEKRVNYDK